MHHNNKKIEQIAPTYLRQMFLYVASPCMNLHILNPNKIM